jgi:hypothetical protein
MRWMSSAEKNSSAAMPICGAISTAMRMSDLGNAV